MGTAWTKEQIEQFRSEHHPEFLGEQADLKRSARLLSKMYGEIEELQSELSSDGLLNVRTRGSASGSLGEFCTDSLQILSGMFGYGGAPTDLTGRSNSYAELSRPLRKLLHALQSSYPAYESRIVIIDADFSQAMTASFSRSYALLRSNGED